MLLRLIEGATDHGCGDEYDRAQCRAIYLGYESSLFANVLGPFRDSSRRVRWAAGRRRVARTVRGRPPSRGRASGARCSPSWRRAPAAGCSRICGAISLDAVPSMRERASCPATGPAAAQRRRPGRWCGRKKAAAVAGRTSEGGPHRQTMCDSSRGPSEATVLNGLSAKRAGPSQSAPRRRPPARACKADGPGSRRPVLCRHVVVRAPARSCPGAWPGRQT